MFQDWLGAYAGQSLERGAGHLGEGFNGGDSDSLSLSLSLLVYSHVESL